MLGIGKSVYDMGPPQPDTAEFLPDQGLQQEQVTPCKGNQINAHKNRLLEQNISSKEFKAGILHTVYVCCCGGHWGSYAFWAFHQ